MIHYDAIVVGAGFSGLSAATHLAQRGHSVAIVEKNLSAGGRARSFEASGFSFDMGPSWYWMPDIIESYFQSVGTSVEEHLELVRLNPSYRVWFEGGPIDVPAGQDRVGYLFESMEPGARTRFHAFMGEAKTKYEIAVRNFISVPGHSPFELVKPQLIPQILGLSIFGSLSDHVHSHFSDRRIRQILEFPVLFLGAKPDNTPALYSMMNYADTALGTWYPMGGMKKLVEAMESIARNAGIQFYFDHAVTSIDYFEPQIVVETSQERFGAYTVVASADYHHVEQSLLPPRWRRYDEDYWSERTLAPSSLIFFLGVNKRLRGLEHHNLFFDADFNAHASTIYDQADWPKNPLFYVCAPSRTDSTVAPKDCENLFILIPLPPGLADDRPKHEGLFQNVIDRMEGHLREDIKNHVVYRRDYAHSDFERDYNAYSGNAYGLANTLNQTAFLKPKMRSKLPGLFFAGQLTSPGPGVPPSLLSGQMAAKEANLWIQNIPSVKA